MKTLLPSMAILLGLMLIGLVSSAQPPKGSSPGAVPAPTEQPVPPPAPERTAEEKRWGGILPGVPEKLEDMIELGLRSNPDILRVQAELNAARLKLTQEITEIYNKRIELARHFARATQQLEPIETSGLPQSVLDQRLDSLENVQAEYRALKVRARYVLGMGSGMANVPAVGPLPPIERRIQQPRPALDRGSRLGKALETIVTLEFENMELREVLEFITEYVGVNFTVDREVESLPITISVRDSPLLGNLHALVDLGNGLCFVIRDYGIFATTRERAQTINAPTIPEDVPLYVPVLEGPLHPVEGVAEPVVQPPVVETSPDPEAPSLQVEEDAKNAAP